MTVRIDDFKTALTGGGARQNLFRVNCNWPNGNIEGLANTPFGAGETEALSSFMIKTAAMPARTIGEVIGGWNLGRCCFQQSSCTRSIVIEANDLRGQVAGT